MFGLFESRPYFRPDLGTLTRSRRMWRGTIRRASQQVPLAVSGTRQGPAPAPVALAADCAAPEQLPVWKQVKFVYLAASPVDGKTMTELGYATVCDTEHTLVPTLPGMSSSSLMAASWRHNYLI